MGHARRPVTCAYYILCSLCKRDNRLIYPFDSNPDLKAQKYYSRSVWQVARIEVK
jgi:hypothetical protein